VIHGFNGLRIALTDHFQNNPLIRRGLVYMCIIGAAILLAVGTGALIGTIPDTAIEMAQQAMESLHP
jgi:succinate dehydrogenase hydrophobic anchor subunit